MTFKMRKELPPDHPVRNGLVIFVPKQTTSLNQDSAGGESSSAPLDPMLPAMNGLEEALQAMAKEYNWQGTERQPQEQSAPRDSNTQAPTEGN